MNRLSIALMLCLCWGAAFAQGQTFKKGIETPATLCNQIDALNRQTPSHVLVVGEVHGTVQIPEAVQCISQRLLRKGQHVALALELPSAAIDAVAVSRDGTARLQVNPQWEKFWDGKTSEAMYGLIAWAKRNGVEAISVEALTQAVAETGKPRTDTIAQRIAERAMEWDAKFPHGQWKLVSLVGRFHAKNLENSDIPQRLADSGVGKPLIAIVKLVNGEAWVGRGGHFGVQDMGEDQCTTEKVLAHTPHHDLCLLQSTASIPAVLRAAKSDADDR